MNSAAIYLQMQALWAMAAVSKSSMTARRMAASAIISSAGNHAAGNSDTQRLIKQFTVLCDQLIRLCHFAPAGRVKCGQHCIAAHFCSSS